MKYDDFIKQKLKSKQHTGFKVSRQSLSDSLYDFQKDIVLWSLRKGRSAIFLDCGMGKTIIQLEWAREVFIKENKNILILDPLAVSVQTQREGKKFNYNVNICESQSDVINGINITNYEKLHKFDLSAFGGIVLDESSILKSYSGKFRNEIIEKTEHIKYKLACTATPSPNDIMELGNHSEFLGYMKRSEMLSTYFIHDSSDTSKWRLKKHANNRFWEWVCTWAVLLKKPSDIGYPDKGFNLPPVEFIEHIIEDNNRPIDGMLFKMEAQTLNERRDARRQTLNERVDYIADIINKSNEPWIIWCNLNAEGDLLEKKIKDSVQISGSDKNEFKKQSMVDFTNGKIKRLISKPLISGFGMNWQHCNNMAFVGLSDSYEQFYQATRRCWRFGQKKKVNVHIVISELEGAVLTNIKRKEKEAEIMKNEIVKNVKEFIKENIIHEDIISSNYITDFNQGKKYDMYLGDCVEMSKNIKDDSIDYSVFSPPFAELYVYSDSERDMGNSKNYDSFFEHFKYLTTELFRVIKPGRLVTFHCIDIPAMKERDGYIGLKDFPGDLIRVFQESGFIYHGKHVVWKDPLIEAVRTKAIGLMHKQIENDSARCRAGLPDYVITMRKPGENINPITHPGGFKDFHGENETKEKGIKYSHNTWRKYASPVWMDIRQGNTLNFRIAKSNHDEKHICPLQLDTIARCLALYSNENDIVFSPFAGVGSEGYQSILMGRKFVGIELKKDYYDVAISNLEFAQDKVNEPELFNEK